jgi:predicted  nucleic acid-binding Zn-ribbon protein
MDKATEHGLSPVLLTDDGQLSDGSRLRKELQASHERMARLNHLLRDAADRRRFGGDGAASQKAAEDERTYLAELDRLMTRIRAIEGQLLIRKRRLH